MTREEFNKLYLGKAIHCDTEEKANHFLALADSVGYRWLTKRRLINCNQWEKHKEKTCYEITDDGLMFADTNYFNPHSPSSHRIIEYQPSLKFKVGDKVRVNSTIFETLNGEVGVIVGVIVDADSLSPLIYCVKVGPDVWTMLLYENQLEKFEEQICKEETIDNIIEEIKEHQKSINVLLNRLEMKAITHSSRWSTRMKVKK